MRRLFVLRAFGPLFLRPRGLKISSSVSIESRVASSSVIIFICLVNDGQISLLFRIMTRDARHMLVKSKLSKAIYTTTTTTTRENERVYRLGVFCDYNVVHAQRIFTFKQERFIILTLLYLIVTIMEYADEIFHGKKILNTK